MHCQIFEINVISKMKHFVPLFVVPTDLTERTEAYGVIFLESTERIDATRHTMETR